VIGRWVANDEAVAVLGDLATDAKPAGLWAGGGGGGREDGGRVRVYCGRMNGAGGRLERLVLWSATGEGERSVWKSSPSPTPCAKSFRFREAWSP